MKPGWRRVAIVAAVLVSALAVSAWYKQRAASLQEAGQPGSGTPAATSKNLPESKPARAASERPGSPRERPERDRTARPQ